MIAYACLIDFLILPYQLCLLYVIDFIFKFQKKLAESHRLSGLVYLIHIACLGVVNIYDPFWQQLSSMLV